MIGKRAGRHRGRRAYESSSIIGSSMVLVLLMLSMMVIFPSSFVVVVVDARGCERSWRRDWRDLTCQQQDEYLDAVRQLKDSGIYDYFSLIHRHNAPTSHGTPEFFPWHRYFIWQFEKALQHVTGKCIYIPYWSTERDAEREWLSPVFHPDTFGSYDGVVQRTSPLNNDEEIWCTDDGIADTSEWTDWVHDTVSPLNAPMEDNVGGDGDDDALGWDEDGDFSNSTTVWDDDGLMKPVKQTLCLQRDFNDIAFVGEAQILADITNYDQYGDSTDSSAALEGNGFRAVIEGIPHTNPHLFLGGHMRTTWSAEDPLFYLHHSNVDRFYTLWQNFHGHDELFDDPWSFEVPQHYEGDLLDEPMAFGYDPDDDDDAVEQSNMEPMWDFTLSFEVEETDDDTTTTTVRRYPTPREVMALTTPSSIIQVTYRNDYLSTLLPQFSPNPLLFQTAIGDIDGGGNDDDDDDIPVLCRRDDEHTARRERRRRTASIISSWSKSQIQSAMTSMTTTTHKKQQLRRLSSLETNTLVSPNTNEDKKQIIVGDKQVEDDVSSTTYDHDHQPQTCQQLNPFTRPADRHNWNQLCTDLPATTSVKERFALLAEMDCRRRGNPLLGGNKGNEDGTDERFSSVDLLDLLDTTTATANSNSNSNAASENESIDSVTTMESHPNVELVNTWIQSMGQSQQLYAFGCFHRPDLQQ
jgi:Common central domain of tyrosinase